MTKRLAEVAKKAGVSEATVSRVLNGRSGVSESTRASVLTALDVLGYERPDQAARRARPAGRPGAARAAEPDLPGARRGGDRRRWRSAASRPALCARTIGGVPERDYIEMLLDHQVSGVVFAGGSYALADAEHGHYRQLLDRRMPVVMVNAGVDDLGFPHISTDDAVAVEQAYGHLRSLGPRADRHGARPGGPRAVAPQAGRGGRGRGLADATTTGWSSAPSSRWRAPGWPPPG